MTKHRKENVTVGIDPTFNFPEWNPVELRHSVQSIEKPGETTTFEPSPENAPKMPVSAAGVRTWAGAQGHKVSDRGRVPGDVHEAYEAYEAAHI